MGPVGAFLEVLGGWAAPLFRLAPTASVTLSLSAGYGFSDPPPDAELGNLESASQTLGQVAFCGRSSGLSSIQRVMKDFFHRLLEKSCDPPNTIPTHDLSASVCPPTRSP